MNRDKIRLQFSDFFKLLIENKKDLLGHPDGKSFENVISKKLQEQGILPIAKSEADRNISKKDKIRLRLIAKEEAHSRINFLKDKYKSNFIKEPFGTQNYPDFLVFLDDEIFCLEVKFSTKSGNKPFWNTGIPLFRGIYIFGSYGLKDLTFFFGGDVLGKNDYEKLKEFFNKSLYNDYVNRYNEENFKNQKRGFNVYIRKAFEQSQKNNPEAILNYFSHPERERCENLVIDFFK